MYLNYNKLLNILIVAILSLIVMITLLLFMKIAKKPHLFHDGADIEDTYTPYNSWRKVR
jgi:hypothetical protein